MKKLSNAQRNVLRIAASTGGVRVSDGACRATINALHQRGLVTPYCGDDQWFATPDGEDVVSAIKSELEWVYT